MNALYAGMLVTLGFLVAALMAVVFLPAYRRRIDRFAREMIKRELPLTEDEVRADRDRLRAEHAMQLHKLEAERDEMRMAAARQTIDLNKRDAKIHELSELIEDQKLAMEEHENARRVLEQAILDRLPKVEQRLTETRKLLAQRDAEISLLSETASKQTSALEEAAQINQSQRSELERLQAAINTRAARNRETLGDPRFDGEVALRSEIEALRNKSREQADIIKKLESLERKNRDRVRVAARDQEIAELKIELGRLRTENEELREGRSGDDAEALELARKVSELQRNERAQTREIARLKAALAAATAAPGKAVQEARETGDEKAAAASSGLGNKAELEAIRRELAEARREAGRLEAELQSSQERLARQADEFRDELRRLSVQVVNARAGQGQDDDAQRRRPSLVERMGVPRPPRLTSVNLAAVSGDGDAGHGDGKNGAANSVEVVAAVPPALPGSDNTAVVDDDGRKAAASARRPRLLDRINQLDK